MKLWQIKCQKLEKQYKDKKFEFQIQQAQEKSKLDSNLKLSLAEKKAKAQ